MSFPYQHGRFWAVKAISALFFVFVVANQAPAFADDPKPPKSDTGAEKSEAPPAPEAKPDAAAKDFTERCSGCHTVGGGKLKGPDLIPATQWPVPALEKSIKSMEKHIGPIGGEEVAAFIALLKDADVKKRLEAERARSIAEMAARLDAPDADLGEALFHGEEAFANGGLPCGSCHRVGERGGSLGPDLTLLATKMPRIGMLSAFEKANFPVMRAAYKDHVVTKQEAVHLAAFFESIEASPEDSATRDAPWIAPAGVGLALILLILIAFAYRNRGPAGVRSRMVRDAQRS